MTVTGIEKMKKTFTLDDFQKSNQYTSVESEGRWSDIYGKWDINYSSILTELIQNAGRWCEMYASDLFIDWHTIEKYLENRTPENKSFLFGFRQFGVDHDTFIFSRCNQRGDFNEYRTIYRLDITFVEDPDKYWSDDMVKMTLYRVK